jgi:hypothetical protein
MQNQTKAFWKCVSPDILSMHPLPGRALNPNVIARQLHTFIVPLCFTLVSKYMQRAINGCEIIKTVRAAAVSAIVLKFTISTFLIRVPVQFAQLRP